VLEEFAKLTAVVLALAFLAESLTEYLLQETKLERYQKWFAICVGILLAFNFRLDIFSAFVDLDSWIPYAGVVLTGILLSRGANWLHDFLKRLTGADGGN